MSEWRIGAPIPLTIALLAAFATSAWAGLPNKGPMAGDEKASSAQYWQSPQSADHEDYVREPMPPGFQVIGTELDGPVYADARGRTLYTWPLHRLRNGAVGDRPGQPSSCGDTVYKVNSGLMSPYPGGLLLPELDKRPSCAQVWPPVLASADAKPVGKWTLVERENGAKQWAYDRLPLYFSILDHRPGDVLGGTKVNAGSDSPAVRVPLGPAALVPPQFQVIQMATGRLVATNEAASVYTWDGDEPNDSNCYDSCLDEWTPVLAPEAVRSRGEWGVIERSPGIRQWTFRQKPLYTHNGDRNKGSVIGTDVSGWHNVYTQRALPPPAQFTVQDSRVGQVLATADGRTIYYYSCGDDALDQLACDHPDTPQAYRLAICGNGDPKLCRETFPYVPAARDAKSVSRLWSVMSIDPNTGHRAAPDQPGALRVWAYRDRPVYTYTDDHQPWDANGDAYGEFYGHRNGFKAFWLRDDFLGNAMVR